MASRIIHYGPDNSYRLPVLRNAGFAVEDCDCEYKLTLALATAADAVAISECDGQPPESAIAVTRSSSNAPLILFQGRGRQYNVTEFDLVVPVLTPPEIWLREIGALIARSSALRSEAACLRQESAQLGQECEKLRNALRIERDRGRLRRAQNRVFPSGLQPPDRNPRN